jgi:FeS assembly SUF system protein
MDLDTSRLHGKREEAAAGAGAAEPPRELPAPLTPDQIEQLRQAVIAELHRCFDPEIPVNIYELGLIYKIDIEPSGSVYIAMTLTSPACPVAGSLPGDVKAKVSKVDNVTAVKVDVVWEPPWDKDRMSEAAKLQLGIDD